MYDDTILRVNNLSFSYDKETPLLCQLNLQVKAKEIICIVGPNGVGKTTLLKSLVGLIDFEGELFYRNNQVKNFEHYKKNIAYIPTTPLLYNILTGYEYLQLIKSIWGIEADLFWENVRFYSEKVNMSKYLNNKIENYSNGMKDKLFFIANISRNPDIIFLDEPFLSWDIDSRQIIIQLLREYVEFYEKAVVLVTHSMQLRNKLADKVYEFRNYNLVKGMETKKGN